MSQLLVDRLEHCREVRSGEWMARCPAHQDSSPSLSIRQLDDGRTLINCFAGCGALDVLDAVGLDYSALYPATDRHQYRSEIRRREKTIDELVVEIAVADMGKGKKLSEVDKQRAREALYRMGNGIKSPE